MARVTLQTIADRVGVSRMTVSNAFSRPDQLSAELRARILAAADPFRKLLCNSYVLLLTHLLSP